MSAKELVSTVTGFLPVADRKKYKALVTGIVSASILAVSNRHPFWWRKVYKDVSITSGTATANLPENCQIVASDNIRVVDTDGNPLAFIKHVYEDEFDTIYINGDDQYGTGNYPSYWTVPTQSNSTNKQTIKLLSSPKNSFLARTFFWQYGSLGDLQNIVDPMTIVDYAVARLPGIEDPQKHLTLFSDAFNRMVELDKSHAGESQLRFAVDPGTAALNAHITAIQERR